MDGVIKKIIDAESQAQSILEDTSKLKEQNIEALQSIVQKRKKELMDRASLTVDKIRSYEKNIEQQRKAEAEQLFDSQLSSLKDKFDHSKQVWIDAMFDNVLKMVD